MFEGFAIASGAVCPSHLLNILTARTPSMTCICTQFLSVSALNSFLPTRKYHVTLKSPAAQHSASFASNGTDESSERQRLFNSIAPVYDNLNNLLSLGMHKVWKRMCVSWSRAAKGDFVLDLCCGSGDIALILAQRVGTNGKVIGLDFAKEQLQVAMLRQHESPVTSSCNIEWIFGDALNLPFEEGTFDAVTIGYGLRNVADIPRCLKEVHRVLKPGSTTSILDFNHSTSVPTKFLQEWILDNIVVPVSRQVGAEEEYAYLKRSISKFPTGRNLKELKQFHQHSLASVCELMVHNMQALLFNVVFCTFLSA